MQKPALLGLLLGAAVACSDSTGPEDQGTVVLQLATTGTGSTTAGLAIPVTVGGNTLIVEDVQLVARKIRLEQDDGNCSNDDPNEDVEEEENEDEECPVLKLGPLLLDPPIGEGVVPEFTVTVPAGTYEGFQMQIHKPSNHNGDAALVAQHPEFAGVSIKVTGTWNGTPFTFTTDLTTVIEVEFDTPLVIEAEGETAMTLVLDVSDWFLAQGGAALINPLTLTQQTRSQIELNIRQSFHAFEDED